MERGNKRSPRIDDEMTRETEALLQSGQSESRSSQALIKEGLLPDETPPVGAPSAYEPPAPGQPAEREIDLRSEVAVALLPSLFPADRDGLTDWARDHDVPPRVLDLLEQVPSGETFPNVEAVWEAAGGVRERRA